MPMSENGRYEEADNVLQNFLDAVFPHPTAMRLFAVTIQQ